MISNIEKGSVREFLWLCRHGKLYAGWRRKPLFCFGRTWYDGPIYFINIGYFGASLHQE